MVDNSNFAEITFTNPIIIDIFSRYTDNSVLAEIVSETGEIHMRFAVSPSVEPPKSCEQVLSLLYALFESNPSSRIGQVYAAHQQAILRETVYRLSQVLDGFGDIKLILHTTAPVSDMFKHTECTITRTRTNS